MQTNVSQLRPNDGDILFITHETSRTGAPMMLLHFLRWLKQNTKQPFKILLMAGGDLQKDFEELAPTVLFNRGLFRRNGVLARSANRLGQLSRVRSLHHAQVAREVGEPPALIYSNTIVNAEALQALSVFRCPVITHVHELEFSFRCGVGPAQSQTVLDRTTHFVACAEAVRSNLIDHHSVSPARVDTVHEFLPTAVAPRPDTIRSSILAELGLPSDALLVGGVGTLGWRKGTDLFVQAAQQIQQWRPGQPIYFFWMGYGSEVSRQEMLHDIRIAGLDSVVRVLGSKSNPLDYLAAFDVFLLLSREDPYPLVCLESASVGVPIICFDKAGGMPEFVEQDCGVVVPYLDVNAVVREALALLDDPERRHRLGTTAKAKVQARHDVNQEAPKLLSIIHRVIATRQTGAA